MPQGRKLTLTDQDFFAAAVELDRSGDKVTLSSLRMYFGISASVVQKRSPRLRKLPGWKPEWLDPRNSGSVWRRPFPFGRGR